jgi:spore photoproduct lyase
MSIQKLYIDRQVKNAAEVSAIVGRLDLPYEIVSNPQVVYDCMSAASDPIQKAKTVLFLTCNKGAFIRKCPGTRFYTCCGYEILHIGTFCHMECTYCILQSYFHPPVLQYFVNHKDLFAELDRVFSDTGIHRIGTGEFTDHRNQRPGAIDS